MKPILTTIVFISLAVTGVAQTRNVIVDTDGVVQSPTNFWSADVTNARSGLGLGTAATNPASAFQSASVNLSNLASSNGGILTNIQASNLVGFINITNIPTAVTLSNIDGILSLEKGGTAATNADNARQNLGASFIGNALFTATNESSARVSIGALSTNGDAINLTNFPALLLRTNGSGASLTNIAASNISGIVGTASNVTGIVAIINGGSGATTAGGARTNLGLGANSTNEVGFGNVKMGNSINYIEPVDEEIVLGLPVDTDPVYLNPIHWNDGGVRTALGLGLSVLTNTNVSNFRTAIGLGVTNDVTFGSVTASSIKEYSGIRAIDLDNFSLTFGTNYVLEWSATEVVLAVPLSFSGTNTATTTRTNLGLGWSALTNTNTSGFNTSLYGSGTNPVLYNTNGEVVSPTNFWQVAPIVTRFVEFDPATNATTNVVAARNLHIHSLAISRTGVTSTIALPITNSFNGDIALVVHQGPTSSVTAVRTAGAGTNLVTLNQFEQTVEFVFYDNVWQFNHNRSFIEPIFFSGTNTAANAAASRTNLGLGNISSNVYQTTNTAVFVNTNIVATNGSSIFANVQSDYIESPYFFVGDGTNGIVFETTEVSGITRTNLGLGAANSVTFASLTITNSTDNLVASLEGGSSGFPLEIYTTDEQLEAGYGSNNFAIGVGGFGFQIKYGTNSTNWGYPVLTSFGGTNLLQPSNATNFRSAIGLPLPALTNTSNVTFQSAVFTTNAAPTNSANVNAINFNTAVGWMEITLNISGTNQTFRIPLFQ